MLMAAIGFVVAMVVGFVGLVMVSVRRRVAEAVLIKETRQHAAAGRQFSARTRGALRGKPIAHVSVALGQKSESMRGRDAA